MDNFDYFLKYHLETILATHFGEYSLTEEDKKQIVTSIDNNEEIWQLINEMLYNRLEPYKKNNRPIQKRLSRPVSTQRFEYMLNQINL